MKENVIKKVTVISEVTYLIRQRSGDYENKFDWQSEGVDFGESTSYFKTVEEAEADAKKVLGVKY